ncbi:MAG: EAL domain-containing protein [Clostridia bacterium]|nr:EAL domain-containing protein [Clostridia bacterium]
MTTKKLIKEALLSGLEPITILKRNVYSCNGNPEPIAYRTELVINSTILGMLTQEQYQVTADRSERGILLADKALSWVTEAIEAKLAAGERFEWMSLYCPIPMLTKTDLLQKLQELFGGNKQKRQKLMLEFPAHTLYEEPETLRTALLDLKVLGVKSALTGYGSEYCPMMRLASFPFDYVILEPAVNELMKNESTVKAADTLISYARHLRVEVLATDLEGEADQGNFFRADCFGCTMKEEPERLYPFTEFTPDASVLDPKPQEEEKKPAEQGSEDGQALQEEQPAKVPPKTEGGAD